MSRILTPLDLLNIVGGGRSCFLEALVVFFFFYPIGIADFLATTGVGGAAFLC
jgi:hypothetical protein